LDGLKYGAFLKLPKGTYTAEEKTFKVAFPGFDVKDFPAFRKSAIKDATDKKAPYADMPLLLVKEQESVANTDVLLKRLVEVMKRFRAEFDETLNALWPRFDYLLRTSKKSKKMCQTEYSSFRIISSDDVKPPVKPNPAPKNHTIAAFFTESKFNLNNDVKFSVNPSALTGLKVPDPYAAIE
jgi:hypothetical protein